MELDATASSNNTANATLAGATATHEGGFHPGFTTLISCACLIVILLIYMWFEPKVTACWPSGYREPEAEPGTAEDSKARLGYLWSKQRYLEATESLRRQRIWGAEQIPARHANAVIRVDDYASVVDTSASRTAPLVFVTSPSDPK